jgi:hypothetical protein
MMPRKDLYPGNPLQPAPKVVDNPPASSLAKSLSNAKAQVSKAK